MFRIPGRATNDDLDDASDATKSIFIFCIVANSLSHCQKAKTPIDWAFATISRGTVNARGSAPKTSLILLPFGNLPACGSGRQSGYETALTK